MKESKRQETESKNANTNWIRHKNSSWGCPLAAVRNFHCHFLRGESRDIGPIPPLRPRHGFPSIIPLAPSS